MNELLAVVFVTLTFCLLGLVVGYVARALHERPMRTERTLVEHSDDALDIARTVPFVDSNHPTDCTEECCFEIRLTEKTDAFPWDAYEQELTG